MKDVTLNRTKTKAIDERKHSRIKLKHNKNRQINKESKTVSSLIKIFYG